MSTVQPTDKTLVNRAGVDHSAPVGTLMATIQDTDLLLVNRAGVDYKCSGLDFKAAMVPPVTINKPSITSPSNGAGQTITPQSDEIVAVAANTPAAGQTTLTLKTDKGLADFKPGAAVHQDDSAASGTIGSVDATAKTITLATTTGTWSANTGNYVIGTPSLSADAALGETPTFTSSAFAITGSGITHSSSDWQVTLAADTGFASPVVQSMTDTAHLVRWDGGPLQPNTDYIVRVRHNGGGKSSPWSDVVSFKTAAKFSSVLSKPGNLWLGDTSSAAFVTTPVKMVALHVMDAAWAVGTDLQIYKGGASSAATIAATGVTLPDFPITGHGSYGVCSAQFVMSDGSIVSTNGTPAATTHYSFTGGLKAVHVACNTANTREALLMSDGSIWGGVTCKAPSDWTKITNGSTDYVWISFGGADWSGSLPGGGFGSILAVKSDGTVNQIDANTGATTAVAALSGISTTASLFNRWNFALKADGSSVISGGTAVSDGVAATLTPPAGELWAGIAGGYNYLLLRTDKGRVFAVNALSSNFVDWKAPAPANKVLGELNIPRPISNLSLQKMAAGGYAFGFIIP